MSIYKLSVMSLATLVAVALCQQARAESSYDSFGQELINMIKSGGGLIGSQCKDEISSSVNPNNIDKMLREARRGNNCRSVRKYLGIIENGSAQHKKQARFEIIDAYDRAGDEIGAMLAAKKYIKTYGQSEAIRIQVLRVARNNFVKARGRDPLWEKMVLGTHESQTRANPFFQNIIAYNFFRDYPRSKYRSEVEKIYSLASKNVDDHFIGIAKYYMNRKEYKAVIIRLQSVWAIGPDSDIYPESLYMSIQAFIKLAQQVKVVGNGKVIRRIGLRKIDEGRVRSILQLQPTDSLNYKEQVEFLIEQATVLMGYMEEAIPNSSWTKKAQRLFK